MIYAGILAGGSGTRMKTSSIPKQFIKIAGVPIIIRTLRKFFGLVEIEKVVIAINPAWEEYCIDMLNEYEIDMGKVIMTQGGSTRFESLVNLALACPRTDDCLLITHDCARPFLTSRIIKDNIEMVNDYDMVTTSVPTIDTVLISKDQKQSYSVPDRNEIFLDQGPQTVRVKSFLDMVDTLTDEEKNIYMEAGRMFLDKGKKVGIVEGDRCNFKITTEYDLKLAEFLLLNE